MTYTRIPPAEITGVRGAVLKRVSRKRFGGVPEALGVMWHHRPVLMTGFRLGRAVDRWTECDRNLKSYAHMATSALIG